MSLPEGIHLDEGLRAEVRVSGPRQEPSGDLFERSLVEAGLIEEINTPSPHVPEEDRTPTQVEGVNLYCR